MIDVPNLPPCVLCGGESRWSVSIANKKSVVYLCAACHEATFSIHGHALIEVKGEYYVSVKPLQQYSIDQHKRKREEKLARFFARKQRQRSNENGD